MTHLSEVPKRDRVHLGANPGVDGRRRKRLIGVPSGLRTDTGVRRWLYEQSAFTRRTCAVCGEHDWPDLDLHHSTYRGEDMATLVPLCRAHHQEFTDIVWPAVRDWYDRERATLAYVVHGPALADHIREFGPLSLQALRGLPVRDGQLSLDESG
jgi:hypothetical protein